MTFQAGHALPAGMIPVAGYQAAFRLASNEEKWMFLPVVALQAADLPGDPPVAVCIDHNGRAFKTTDDAATRGWRFSGVMATSNYCSCAA